MRTLLDLPQREKTTRGREHTPREICQRPNTWSTTYARCCEHSAELSTVLRRAGASRGAVAPPTVYLLGAGSSEYIGRAVTPSIRWRWGCDAWAVPSTSLLTDFDEFHVAGRKYLWISLSRSGESPEGVALLDRALQEHPNIQHVVITWNQKGTMAQLCSRHEESAARFVLGEIVNDRSLAMTSSFSNMVLAGQCLAHLDDLEQFGNVVDQIAEPVENSFQWPLAWRTP